MFCVCVFRRDPSQPAGDVWTSWPQVFEACGATLTSLCVNDPWWLVFCSKILRLLVGYAVLYLFFWGRLGWLCDNLRVAGHHLISFLSLVLILYLLKNLLTKMQTGYFGLRIILGGKICLYFFNYSFGLIHFHHLHRLTRTLSSAVSLFFFVFRSKSLPIVLHAEITIFLFWFSPLSHLNTFLWLHFTCMHQVLGCARI